MEHDDQATVIEWAEFNTGIYPELAHLFAIPNGGHRHRATAARLKAEGVRAGVPDLCLAVPRGNFGALFIEQKFGTNKPTDDQKWWLQSLSANGYAVSVSYSADQTISLIRQYLNLKAAAPFHKVAKVCRPTSRHHKRRPVKTETR